MKRLALEIAFKSVVRHAWHMKKKTKYFECSCETTAYILFKIRRSEKSAVETSHL